MTSAAGHDVQSDQWYARRPCTMQCKRREVGGHRDGAHPALRAHRCARDRQRSRREAGCVRASECPSGALERFVAAAATDRSGPRLRRAGNTPAAGNRRGRADPAQRPGPAGSRSVTKEVRIRRSRGKTAVDRNGKESGERKPPPAGKNRLNWTRSGRRVKNGRKADRETRAHAPTRQKPEAISRTKPTWAHRDISADHQRMQAFEP